MVKTITFLPYVSRTLSEFMIDYKHNGKYLGFSIPSLIESPDPSNPNSRDLSLGGVFADSEIVELEIFRHFFCGHDLVQNRISRRRAFLICEAMGWCFS